MIRFIIFNLNHKINYFYSILNEKTGYFTKQGIYKKYLDYSVYSTDKRKDNNFSFCVGNYDCLRSCLPAAVKNLNPHPFPHARVPAPGDIDFFSKALW